MSNQLVFNNTPLSVTTLNNEIWLTSAELAKALQYTDSKSVTRLYKANIDEFTPNMSEVIESVTSRNLKTLTRIFSLRGAHLIAMFSRTDVAKEFRKWVLDILEKESKLQTSPEADIPLPREVLFNLEKLIPVFTGIINQEEIKLSNARDLHSFLQSKQDFSTWIKKRINDYEFAENMDFLCFHKKMEANNATIIEYHITLDMAKELAMVERTDKGRQARKYFIECERKLKAILNNSPAVTKELPPQIETIKFYGQDIDVVFYSNQPYIIIKQISDNIGLHTESQRIQVQKNKSLNKSTCMINLPTNGGSQRHLCLPLSMLNAWLNNLVPSRTKTDEALKLYQSECFNYLFNHFSSQHYQKPTYSLPNKTGTEPQYEKLTAAQTRNLTQLVHSISRQFRFDRTANNAIWFALRTVTGTPSPERFDIRHLPILIDECKRINSIVCAYFNLSKQHEQDFIQRILRKREPNETVFNDLNLELKETLQQSDQYFIESLQPFQKLDVKALLS